MRLHRGRSYTQAPPVWYLANLAGSRIVSPKVDFEKGRFPRRIKPRSSLASQIAVLRFAVSKGAKAAHFCACFLAFSLPMGTCLVFFFLFSQKGRKHNPAVNKEILNSYCGWTKCISHHLETMGNWYLQGKHPKPGSLRWCEVDVVPPQNGTP